MAPSPAFSVYKPRKIRLSVTAATEKEVAVCGVAATVDISIFRIHCTIFRIHHCTSSMASRAVVQTF